MLLTPLQASELGQSQKLTVIYDSGDTLSIAPYLPKPRERSPSTKQVHIRLPFKLPITTPSMQPGKVATTAKLLKHLQQPLFLVGSDSLSQAWLKENRDELIRIGAVGLLVEAKTLKDIKAMLAIAKGLRLVPVSAESAASELGLKTYPILLSKEGWEQ